MRLCHLAGVVDFDQQLAQQLGGHQVVLSRQHKQAGVRQILRPQALPMPDKLPAEGLRRQTHTPAFQVLGMSLLSRAREVCSCAMWECIECFESRDLTEEQQM